ELGDCALARRVAHPGERREVVAQSRDQILDHPLRARAGRGRESLLDVNLTERLAQSAVGRADTALPTRLHLLRAREVLAVEVEVLLDELRRERGRGGVDAV